MAISQITSNSIAAGAVSASDLADGSVSAAKLASGAALSNLGTSQLARANMPAGSVLQVVQTVKTSNFSTTSGSYVDITGYSATITPSSASSKILIISNFFAGSNLSPYPKFKLLRDSTDIFLGDSYGSATRQSAGMVVGTANDVQIISVATSYLDSPATTSSITYKWQVYVYDSRAIYIGSSQGSSDFNNSSVPSTITLMEIAA